MSKSKIEWTDRTWNPVTGCTKVSQGCKNCYALRMYERFNGPGSFKNVICHQSRLTMPLQWQKPSMVFVNSMSDLFHEDVPFVFIDAVFSVMSDVSRHTYQVLTKRPKRMLDFFQWKKEMLGGITWQPSDNVWIGVSVEDQKAADERIPLLLQVEASVLFLSCEPLLGPLDLSKYLKGNPCARTGNKVDWVIVGGESGHGARPMHPSWVRSIAYECLSTSTPFFFKQWGEYVEGASASTPLHQWHTVDYTGKIYLAEELLPKGKDIVLMSKVGKKKAGNLLDGRSYLQWPIASKKMSEIF